MRIRGLSFITKAGDFFGTNLSRGVLGCNRIYESLIMRFLWVFLIISPCVLGSESSNVPIARPSYRGLTELTGLPVRSLKALSPNHETVLVAALDGTISLVDTESQRVIWSFSSGPPIYSSYHAPFKQDGDNENSSESSSGYYIDCRQDDGKDEGKDDVKDKAKDEREDDWELFAFTEHFQPAKLRMNIEEYVKTTPIIAEDGSATLGDRTTTVFEVDALTGRLLRTYGMSGSPSTSLMNVEHTALHNETVKDLVQLGSAISDTVQQLLKITRTDYSLKHFGPKSARNLWNLTVSKVGAALICNGDENSLREAPARSRLGLGSESGNPFQMPFSCQSRGQVYHFRRPGIYDSLPRLQPYKGMQLPGPNSRRELLTQQPNLDKALPLQSDSRIIPPRDLALPRGEGRDSAIKLLDGSGAVMLAVPVPEIDNLRVADRSFETLDWSGSLLFLVTISVIVGLIYLYSRKTQEHAKQVGDSNLKTLSKKKKPRKPGKSNGSPGSKEKHFKTEDGEGIANSLGENDAWMKLNKIVEGSLDGRKIGKLFVSNTEIAKGSNGTVVLEGIYEGRPVAVKRLVKTHHDVAIKEIENLIASDRHPNIVRWYGLEFDQDFAYVSLERCTCSLDDMIQVFSDSTKDTMFPEDPSPKSMIEYKARLDSARATLQDLNLWKPNGHPSPLLLKLMRDVVSGLVHLHDLGIIHRDLKPQNVLINKERSLCAKLSDMGISKRLHADMSSLGYHATGCGSSGWQAPEQLLRRRQTRAVDVFSLGCVLFFCITGGRHPFGDRFERDMNIVKNKMDLFLVEFMPEAVDLFSRLLKPDPELRPKALDVLLHPMFWTAEIRLSFFRDMSDRVELEDRESESDLFKALEKTAPLALGGKWDEKMEPAFIANIGRYRHYKYDSVRDLLRVMRNKLNHYRELPKEIQELLGPVPEGFDNYFAGRFPKLLIEVYRVAWIHCKEEEFFKKYFRSVDL